MSKVPEREEILVEELKELQRLLRGACRSLVQAGVEMGPQVQAWWKQQPDFIDEQAGRAVLSLSDAEYEVLYKFVKANGSMPARK